MATPLGFRDNSKAQEADRMRKIKRDAKTRAVNWDEYTRHLIEGINRLATDEKTVAERQWQKSKLAPKPQQPCDVGLFSDDANQKEFL